MKTMHDGLHVGSTMSSKIVINDHSYFMRFGSVPQNIGYAEEHTILKFADDCGISAHPLAK
jgi:hypothetical protein